MGMSLVHGLGSPLAFFWLELLPPPLARIQVFGTFVITSPPAAAWALPGSSHWRRGYLCEPMRQANLCGCSGGGARGEGVALELVYGTGPTCGAVLAVAWRARRASAVVWLNYAPEGRPNSGGLKNPILSF